MVRIIAGSSKGCKVLVPPFTNKIRPTADRVKESVFSILRPHIEGAVVLDLFCGSGNLGLEALSEGASKCYFIEKDSKCIELLKRNITKMNVSDRSHISQGDVIARIKTLSGIAEPCTIVFADPPYDQASSYLSGKRNILNHLIVNGIITTLTIFVFEHGSAFDLPGEVHQYEDFYTKNYGTTSVSIFRCNRKGDGQNEQKTAGCLSG